MIVNSRYTIALLESNSALSRHDVGILQCYVLIWERLVFDYPFQYTLSVEFTGLFRFIITIMDKLINETRQSGFVSGGSLDPLGGMGKWGCSSGDHQYHLRRLVMSPPEGIHGRTILAEALIRSVNGVIAGVQVCYWPSKSVDLLVHSSVGFIDQRRRRPGSASRTPFSRWLPSWHHTRATTSTTRAASACYPWTCEWIKGTYNY